MKNENNSLGKDFLVDKYQEMLDKNTNYFFDLDELIHIADYYIDYAMLENAKEVVKYASLFYPNHLEISLKRIELNIFDEKFEEALFESEELIDKGVKDAELYILNAKALSAKEQHSKAIEKLIFVLTDLEYEFKDEIYGLLGMEYYNLGFYSRAIDFYHKSLNLNPDAEYDFLNILQCYESLEDTYGAIVFIEKELLRNPVNDLYWHHLGLLYENRKKWSKALQCFEYSIALNPHFVESYERITKTLERQKKYYEAINWYHKAINQALYSPYYFFKIGLCYKKMGDLENSIEFFTKCIEVDPTFELAWDQLSRIFYNLNKNEEALFALERSLELAPDNKGFKKRLDYFHSKGIR